MNVPGARSGGVGGWVPRARHALGALRPYPARVPPCYLPLHWLRWRLGPLREDPQEGTQGRLLVIAVCYILIKKNGVLIRIVLEDFIMLHKGD